MTSAQRQPSFPTCLRSARSCEGFDRLRGWRLRAGHLFAGVTDRLDAAIVAAMTSPGMREQLQEQGAVPVGSARPEFAAFVRDDVQRWAPIVEAIGMRGLPD